MTTIVTMRCSNNACVMYMRRQRGWKSNAISGSPLCCRKCRSSLEEIRITSR